MEEFIIMLLLEEKCINCENFYDFLLGDYDIKKFNSRYDELLKEFLTPYALNKTEKSEENNKQ